MAAYRMFPPVGPDKADELAAGDTSVGFGPIRGHLTKRTLKYANENRTGPDKRLRS
jgi:hypothetical protein